MTKSIEELEREFAREVQHFVDVALRLGYSLEQAKTMARDVVARAVRKQFTVVKDEPR
jgi:uncharacterized protein YaaR (DUF327 family)